MPASDSTAALLLAGYVVVGAVWAIFLFRRLERSEELRGEIGEMFRAGGGDVSLPVIAGTLIAHAALWPLSMAVGALSRIMRGKQ